MVLRKIFFAILLIFSVSTALHAEIIIRAYNGYILWIDTEQRGPVFFMYNLGPDNGNYNKRNYKPDPWLDSEFQQKDSGTYASVHQGWDLGHLVPLNHLDSYTETAAATEYLTDIVPQASYLNQRGTWRETEKIIECLREDYYLTIFGGVIWGDDESNDYFVESHGIKTPDFLWKAILHDVEVIAWIMPNTDDTDLTRAEKLDDYICSIDEISEQAFIPIYLPGFIREQKPETTWKIDCTGNDWKK